MNRGNIPVFPFKKYPAANVEEPMTHKPENIKMQTRK